MEKISGEFTSEFRQVRTVDVFCKTLYLYFILKIIASWPIWVQLVKYQPPRINHSIPSSILFLPAQWASQNLDLFCWLGLALALAAVFIRLNYFTAIMILWMAINAYKINFPAANGSDLVFLLLLGFAVPMCQWPRADRPLWKSVQRSIFNFAVLSCQLQILLIYFASGSDKLMSASWRSGEAIQYISRLDFLFNPRLTFDESASPLLNLCLAWMVIIFELSFPFLVWIKKTRLFILAAGVLFHLVIWIFLSLPDFGLIMMISYLVFLRAEDFERLGLRIGKSLDSPG